MSPHRSTLLLCCAASLVASWVTPTLSQDVPSSPIPNVTSQSDVTGPNTLEVLPSSDVTGPNPTETLPNGGIPDAGALPFVVDIKAFETSFAGGDIPNAVTNIEELNAVEFGTALGTTLYGQTPSVSEISDSLSTICEQTGERTAVIYAVPLEQELQLMAVFPNCPKKQARAGHSWLTAAATLSPGLWAEAPQPSPETLPIRKRVPEANRKVLESTLRTFKRRISDPRQLNEQSYLPVAEKLYSWIVQPLKPDLERNNIETLVFTMGSVLRSLPVSALYDGKKFLVESYNLAQIPSFGLTDTRLRDIRSGRVLAMGASQFERLNPLPSVPTELQSVVATPNLKGERYLNQEFTLQNFIDLNRNQRFSIVHLATHGEFLPGDLQRSFIQLWDQRLTIPQLQALAKSLGWRDPKSVPVDLLVLSACRTAVGDSNAELGFAGLALATGVKSTLASFWSVSDLGTLTLMTEFYEALGQGRGKAQALRQAQLQLLQGKTRIEDGKLVTAEGKLVPLPPELAQQTNLNLSHPYFWSSFMLFGNWH